MLNPIVGDLEAEEGDLDLENPFFLSNIAMTNNCKDYVLLQEITGSQ